jgi:hypothetical protein
MKLQCVIATTNEFLVNPNAWNCSLTCHFVKFVLDLCTIWDCVKLQLTEGNLALLKKRLYSFAIPKMNETNKKITVYSHAKSSLKKK